MNTLKGGKRRTVDTCGLLRVAIAFEAHYNVLDVGFVYNDAMVNQAVGFECDHGSAVC